MSQDTITTKPREFVAVLCECLAEFQRSLPLAPVEITALATTRCDPTALATHSLGCRIHSPISITATMLVLVPPVRRNLLKGPAIFQLKVATESGDYLDGLANLASLMKVRACITSTEPPRPDDDLPFDLCQAATSDGIDIIVPVPTSVQRGACIILKQLSVAGEDIAVDENAVVVIGFSHFRGPGGPAIAAAKSGNFDTLLAALEQGASTEEEDTVRPLLFQALR
jgi:hypothetical protein